MGSYLLPARKMIPIERILISGIFVQYGVTSVSLFKSFKKMPNHWSRLSFLYAKSQEGDFHLEISTRRDALVAQLRRNIIMQINSLS